MNQLIKNKKKTSFAINNEKIVVTLTMTKNNIYCCITTLSGRMMLFNVSAGLLAIKGSLKTQPMAYKDIALVVVKKLQTYGVTTVILHFKGFSYNRKAFFKIIRNNNITVLYILEKTRTPFNGCKANAVRRV